jgi:hypothetical protein
MKLYRLTLGGLTAAALTLAGCSGGRSSPSTIMPTAQDGQTRHASGSSGDVLYVLMSRKTYIVSLPGLTKLQVMRGAYGNVAVSDPNNGNRWLFSRLELIAKSTYQEITISPFPAGAAPCSFLTRVAPRSTKDEPPPPPPPVPKPLVPHPPAPPPPPP